MKFFEKKDLNIESTMQVDVPIHRVLLSFNGDVQAEAFCDWMQEQGLRLFEIWTEANGENYE